MNPTHNCRYWLLVLAILIGLGLILGLTTLVLAQKGATPVAPRATAGTTISVTITADEINGDGDCSLREALQAANTDAQVSGCPAGNGWDTIVVPAGTYTLVLAGPGEDGNGAGDPPPTTSSSAAPTTTASPQTATSVTEPGASSPDGVNLSFLLAACFSM